MSWLLEICKIILSAGVGLGAGMMLERWKMSLSSRRDADGKIKELILEIETKTMRCFAGESRPRDFRRQMEDVHILLRKLGTLLMISYPDRMRQEAVWKAHTEFWDLITDKGVAYWRLDTSSRIMTAQRLEERTQYYLRMFS